MISVGGPTIGISAQVAATKWATSGNRVAPRAAAQWMAVLRKDAFRRDGLRKAVLRKVVLRKVAHKKDVRIIAAAMIPAAMAVNVPAAKVALTKVAVTTTVVTISVQVMASAHRGGQMGSGQASRVVTTLAGQIPTESLTVLQSVGRRVRNMQTATPMVQVTRL